MATPKIDSIVSTELPNEVYDLISYVVVNSFMIHGPCALVNLQVPSMEDQKCKKFYPKQFHNSTMTDKD